MIFVSSLSLRFLIVYLIWDTLHFNVLGPEIISKFVYTGIYFKFVKKLFLLLFFDVAFGRTKDSFPKWWVEMMTLVLGTLL